MKRSDQPISPGTPGNLKQASLIVASLLLALGLGVGTVHAHASGEPREIANGINAELLRAAAAGQVELIQDLLARGASVGTRDSIGRTALMLAAIEGRAEAVKLLLEKGSDIGAANQYGGTALDFAVMNGRAEVVAILVDHGAGLSVNGRPALLAASSPAVAQALLDHGMDVNIRDSTGTTALMVAAGTGRHDVARYLIERGADVNAVTRKGETALSMASTGPFGADRQMVKLLKKAGARK